MYTNEGRLRYLLEKYGQQKANEEETAELLDLLQEAGAEQVFAEHLAETAEKDRVGEEVDNVDWTRIWQGVQEGVQPPVKMRRIIHVRRWAAAAAILVAFAGVGLTVWKKMNPSPQIVKVLPVNDVEPGKEGAILTLADGTTIVLDGREDGQVASQQGAQIVLHNGQLAYEKGGSTDSTIAYNTMRTPKGRMFRLLLPDGSAVWLNAASSIRYPTAFTGHQRRVEVTGEAYFEVAHQPKMPFRVSLNGGAAVEVLGTHFNVNAYAEDEQMNITLLEGAVQCSNGSGKAVLKPGQQARMTTGNSPIRVMDHADIEKVMAWKNGLFNFNDASLEEVMRQLERWYDIEVRYEKGIPRIEFIGKMDRSLTLAEVLAGLEMSKVHFRIEGERKLVILP